MGEKCILGLGPLSCGFSRHTLYVIRHCTDVTARAVTEAGYSLSCFSLMENILSGQLLLLLLVLGHHCYDPICVFKFHIRYRNTCWVVLKLNGKVLNSLFFKK